MIIYIEFWFQEYILGIWGIAQSVLFKGKITSLGFCLFIFFTLRKVSYWEADFIPLDLLPSIISPLTVMTGLQIEICIIWHSPFSFYCWSQNCSVVLKYETLLLFFGTTISPKCKWMKVLQPIMEAETSL